LIEVEIRVHITKHTLGGYNLDMHDWVSDITPHLAHPTSSSDDNYATCGFVPPQMACVQSPTYAGYVGVDAFSLITNHVWIRFGM